MRCHSYSVSFIFNILLPVVTIWPVAVSLISRENIAMKKELYIKFWMRKISLEEYGKFGMVQVWMEVFDLFWQKQLQEPYFSFGS